MSQQHPELVAEQRYIDAVYERLVSMRRAAEKVAEGYADVRQGGTHQARLERDAAAALTRRRLHALDIGSAPLCFGRLDLHDEGDGRDAAPRRFYVGRISVNDDDLAPLLVDWRAPVAEPFYRATPVAPMGVVRRRHFLTRPGDGRTVAGIDDEVFDTEAADATGLTVLGEGALLAALERSRTGRMHDIVATIQAEQDEAIRADLPGILVVEGGPGTGKTAVALHRAAYLLYTHHRKLAGDGVLLVGPSSIFLRYIDQVLPSLGEEDVVLATASGLKPQYDVRGVDDAATAALKADARMAQVIRKAVRDREMPARRDLVVHLDGVRLRIRWRALQHLTERARRRRGTHNQRRPFVVHGVVEQLHQQFRSALGAAAPDDPEWDRELDARIRRLPEVRATVDRMWPVLTGAELVHDLFSFGALVRSASDGVLRPAELERLVRPRAASLRDVAWTEADLPLIDEADALLGPASAARPRRRVRHRGADEAAAGVIRELGVGGFLSAADLAARYAGEPAARGNGNTDEPRTFGHVLVDEAQDVTAMQWRMLARRCPSGSMTIVGDFGQASRPGALASWDDLLRQLPQRVPARRVTLTVNYRTPAEIMEVANRLLAAAAPHVEPAQAVRIGGVPPRFLEVTAAELVSAAARAAREAAAAEGTVAVVARAELHVPLTEALADLGAVADRVEALDAPIAVLSARDAKGLEFDHVVVVEPARLVSSDVFGLRLLFVTLTRATRRLVVVHAQPLPEALQPVASGAGASR